jgi:hypothetical protein
VRTERQPQERPEERIMIDHINVGLKPEQASNLAVKGRSRKTQVKFPLADYPVYITVGKIQL